MKKYLFYGQEAIGTVSFKVRNLRKQEIVGKVFKFFFKLAEWNGNFWPNLNQVI